MGVAFVNSNEAKRDAGDSFADMQKRYADKKYSGHYLLDAGHVVADAFGARTTPHVFLFDKDMKLAYKGAIDDNVGSASAVKEQWLQNAIDNMTAGKAIDPATTRNMGCSIKRVAAGAQALSASLTPSQRRDPQRNAALCVRSSVEGRASAGGPRDGSFQRARGPRAF